MKLIASILGLLLLMVGGALAQGFTPVTANGVGGLVVKATPGTLYGFTVKPSADGVLQIIDATSIPALGSIGTPVKCYSMTANVSLGVEWTTIPLWFPTGIVMIVSSGSDCTTRAAGVTAYFSANDL